MSPLWLPPSTLGPGQTNLTAADRDGVTITAGAVAHTKGAWAELFASTNEAISGIAFMIGGTASSATVTNYLLDIGIGAAGSEQVIIQNLDGGWSLANGFNARNKVYFLPVCVPKGSRIAARAQATVASGTVQVAVILYQAAQGWGMEAPVLWESLGINLGSSTGTSVPSADGAFGANTTIVASTAKDYNWWLVGLDGLTDTILTLQDYLVEVASPASTVIGRWAFSTDTDESISGPWPSVPVFRPIPAGSAIIARLAGGTTEARGIKVYAGVARGF